MWIFMFLPYLHRLRKDLAALNLNNMIPVRDEYITEIDLKIKASDSVSIRQWKKLCAKELDWCP